LRSRSERCSCRTRWSSASSPWLALGFSRSPAGPCSRARLLKLRAGSCTRSSAARFVARWIT